MPSELRIDLYKRVLCWLRVHHCIPIAILGPGQLAGFVDDRDQVRSVVEDQREAKVRTEVPGGSVSGFVVPES